MIPPNIAVPTWLAVLMAAGAVATAIVAIVAVVARTGRGLNWFGQWFVLSALENRSVDVVDEALGDVLADRISAHIDAALAPILTELSPNSGKSLKDQVSSIERRLVADVREGRADREAIRNALDAHVEESDARHTRIEITLSEIRRGV